MSGYCDECGNTICLCQDILKQSQSEGYVKAREFKFKVYNEPEGIYIVWQGDSLPTNPGDYHVIEYSHWLKGFDALTEATAECLKLRAELEAWRNDSIVAERDQLKAKLEIRNQPHQIMPDGTVRPVWQYQEVERLQSELAEQQKLHERTRELRNQEIDKLRADLDKYRLDADKRYCDVEDENDKLRAENKSIIENYNQVEVEKLRSDLAIAIEALEQVADTKTHFGKQNYIIAQEALAKLKGEE